MMRLRSAACTLMFWSTSLLAGAQKPAGIPATHAVTLTGAAVDLPAALAGKPGVLVIGFSQSSRTDVTDWGKRLYDEYHADSRVSFYQMAELAGVPKFIRNYVTRKIKESIPEVAQPHFLTLLDHEDEWKASAGYNRSDDAYVMVVDKAGVVRWRFEGAVGDPIFWEMKRQLEAASK